MWDVSFDAGSGAVASLKTISQDRYCAERTQMMTPEIVKIKGGNDIM